MELVTKRLKYKDCNPKKANDMAKQFHIKADELEFVNKGFAEVSDGMEIKEGERAVIKYVSTVSVDRDGDVILPDAWLLDDFNKTKLFLYGHNYGGTTFGGKGQLPLGTDMWIKTTDKGLLAKQVYAKHDMADDIYNMHKDGHPLPASVGFIPLKSVKKSDTEAWDKAITSAKEKFFLSDEDLKGANNIITKAYLLEHSDVPVACNPDALTLAVEEGKFQFKSLDLKTELFPEEEVEVVDNSEELKALTDKVEALEAKIAELTKPKTVAPKGITTEKAAELINKALNRMTDKIDIRRGKV